jgi:hypothetical protein
MRGLLIMMLASVAVGLIAGAVYVAYVVSPSVWGASIIMLAASTSANITLRGVAHVVAARHPKPPDFRRVTTIDHAYIGSGETTQDIIPRDGWW